MSYWLRLHTGIVNDPKVQLLRPDQFKGWINLLCVAKENDGLLPSIEDIAFQLRMTGAEAACLIEVLVKRGLLDEEGVTLWPHNWSKWQVTADDLLRGDWATIRLAALERDNWTCQYCGAPATAVDHIIPRSRGGDNEMSNLAAACKPCNSRKKDRTPEEAGMHLYVSGEKLQQVSAFQRPASAVDKTLPGLTGRPGMARPGAEGSESPRNAMANRQRERGEVAGSENTGFPVEDVKFRNVSTAE